LRFAIFIKQNEAIVRRPRGRRRAPFALHRQQEPLDTESAAHSRGIRPAACAHKTVIAPAARDRPLSADGGVHNLKGGARIIIEAAHKPRIRRPRDTERGQPLLQFTPGGGARIAERSGHIGGGAQNFLTRGILAVQHTENVFIVALAAVGA